jgi:HSP20 family protein
MDVRSLIPRSRNRDLPVSRFSEEASPLFSLHHQMDRLLDDFARDVNWPENDRNGWETASPNIDVNETDKEIKVTAELPGLDEKDVDVTWRDGTLTIKGEKKVEKSGSVYSERWHGQFKRSLQVGQDVDPGKISADFKKGVLTITLEKRPEAQHQVKQIAINRSN